MSSTTPCVCKYGRRSLALQTVIQVRGSVHQAMADLLLLILLPLLLLLFASPIKALLVRTKSVLAPELSAVWQPQLASIFVTDHATAHSLLVRGSAGGSFSNRPPSISPSAILSRRRYQNITSAPYGQHWRAIRHNLSSEVLHPARLHRSTPRRTPWSRRGPRRAEEKWRGPRG